MVPTPTCIDCKHALEVAEEPGMVACTAHLEYFPADHPATCAEFIKSDIAGLFLGYC